MMFFMSFCRVHLKGNCNETLVFVSFCTSSESYRSIIKGVKKIALNQVSLELWAAKVALYSILPDVGGAY